MTALLAHDQSFRAGLAARLLEFNRHIVDNETRRRAAVAVLVVADGRGQASVVITRRAMGLRQHGGQFALPGGKVEVGESLEQAARRELEEEVGVGLGAKAVLGLMDDYVTRSGFVITPVVIWGDAVTKLTPDPGEVAETFVVPLSKLARTDVMQTCTMPGSEQPLLALAILGTFIFAPTAAILHHFVELAVYGRKTSVENFDQPRFAWK